MASDGAPNGVFMRTSRVSLSPLIEYSPLPPIMPMVACSALLEPLALPRLFDFSGAIWNFSPNELFSGVAQINRLKLNFAIMFVEGGRRMFGVVSKSHDPAVPHNLGDALALGFQRLHGIQVISGHPR